MPPYDLTQPWNHGVANPQVLPLINDDADTIRVEAGPGTGKTFGLVHRVQRLLHPDGLNEDGDTILVVAFNRVIAKDLEREILAGLEGVPHRGTPQVRTVHGLCLEVVGPPLRLLLPNERDCLIYDVLEAHPDLRRLYGSFEQTAQALRDHEAGHVDHTTLWQAARNWLHRHHAQLVSDLPRLLLERLQTDDVPDRSYRHVIVDEFQDLTAGEQELFLRLRASGGHLVALGDRKQSIYRFRGNSPDGLSHLHVGLHGIRELRDIELPECSRCPANIVSAANQLMSLQGRPMRPGRPENGDIHLVVWKSVEAEAKGMASAIVDKIHRHPDDRHLVMVPRRQLGFMLRDRIAELDAAIGVDLSFSEGVLDSWPVREAFLYLSLRVAPDAPAWRAWLGYRDPTGAQGPTAGNRNAGAYLVLLQRSDDAITERVIESLASEDRLRRRGAGGANAWDRASRFVALRQTIALDLEDPAAGIKHVLDLSHWPAQSDEERASATLDMALLEKKALEHLATLPQEWSGRRKLAAVVDTLRYHIATREPFETKEGIKLKVATLWGAKGATAEHVYVLGLCAEALPGERRPEYPGTDLQYLEEQQRLFYVSLTRAKQTLVLSRFKGIKFSQALRLGLNLPSQPRGQWWARLQPSNLLRDIAAYLPQAVAGDDWEGC